MAGNVKIRHFENTLLPGFAQPSNSDKPWIESQAADDYWLVRRGYMSAFIPAASFLYQPTEQTPVICFHRRNTPTSGTLKLSNKIIRRQIETYLSQYSTVTTKTPAAMV